MLTKNSSVKTSFSGVDFSKYSSKTSEFVKEFASCYSYLESVMSGN